MLEHKYKYDNEHGHILLIIPDNEYKKRICTITIENADDRNLVGEAITKFLNTLQLIERG